MIAVAASDKSDFYSQCPLENRVTASLVAVQSIEELRARVRVARMAGLRIGCVPTMGALHAGHLSLVEAAKRESDFVVLTIFVNPTQFGPHEDFTKYPRPLERDIDLCRSAGVDVVFHPEVADVYPAPNATYVDVPALDRILEGAFRPGHFRGVATIVLKLFNLVLPDVAFFGQKDYQQQLLLKHMAADLNVPVEIRTCPTLRDPDGLAMSSRNIYLSPAERQTALSLSQALKLTHDLIQRRVAPTEIRAAMRQHLESFPGVKIDYATIADAHTLEEVTELVPQMVALIAARVGTTRLIDNEVLDVPAN